MWPIGIGEALHHIIARAVLSTCKEDSLMAMGLMRLCAGQESGCEATAVPVLQKLFSLSEVEAVLLVDATNALNSLTNSTPQHTAHLG